MDFKAVLPCGNCHNGFQLHSCFLIAMLIANVNSACAILKYNYGKGLESGVLYFAVHANDVLFVFL